MLACPDRFFGKDCSEKCIATCAGCNKFNGLCDSGCIYGWKGYFCNEGMVGVVESFFFICILFVFLPVLSSNVNHLSQRQRAVEFKKRN